MRLVTLVTPIVLLLPFNALSHAILVRQQASVTSTASRSTASEIAATQSASSQSGQSFGLNSTISSLPPTSTIANNATFTNSTDFASSSTSLPTPLPNPLKSGLDLDTKITPTFGVLGGLLILSGLPLCLLGSRNRWSSIFIIAAYAIALAVLSLIIPFGVVQPITTTGTPPSSTIQGMYLLAAIVASILAGIAAILSSTWSVHLANAFGGLVIGWWIQSLRSGGLVPSLAATWILFISIATLMFALSLWPRSHLYILMVSTAATGASAVALGIDCFTTLNLKESYVYRLGFASLFPSIKSFPLTQGIAIELGIAGALFIAGLCAQSKVLSIVKSKINAKANVKKRYLEDEEFAAQRVGEKLQDKDDWERRHADSSSTKIAEDSDDFKSFGDTTADGQVNVLLYKKEDEGKNEQAEILPLPDLGDTLLNQMPSSLALAKLKDDEEPSTKSRKTVEDAIKLQAEIDAIKKSIAALHSPSEQFNTDASWAAYCNSMAIPHKSIPESNSVRPNPTQRHTVMDLPSAMIVPSANYQSNMRPTTSTPLPRPITSVGELQHSNPSKVDYVDYQTNSRLLPLVNELVSPDLGQTRSNSFDSPRKVRAIKQLSPSQLEFRHRSHLKALQDPVTQSLVEQRDLAEARLTWERKRIADRQRNTEKLKEGMMKASKIPDTSHLRHSHSALNINSDSHRRSRVNSWLGYQTLNPAAPPNQRSSHYNPGYSRP